MAHGLLLQKGHWNFELSIKSKDSNVNFSPSWSDSFIRSLSDLDADCREILMVSQMNLSSNSKIQSAIHDSFRTLLKSVEDETLIC